MLTFLLFPEPEFSSFPKHTDFILNKIQLCRTFERPNLLALSPQLLCLFYRIDQSTPRGQTTYTFRMTAEEVEILIIDFTKSQ